MMAQIIMGHGVSGCFSTSGGTIERIFIDL